LTMNSAIARSSPRCIASMSVASSSARYAARGAGNRNVPSSLRPVLPSAIACPRSGASHERPVSNAPLRRRIVSALERGVLDARRAGIGEQPGPQERFEPLDRMEGDALAQAMRERRDAGRLEAVALGDAQQA